MSGNDWFATCIQCDKKQGPWTLPKDELCQGHEKYVAGTDIDYPDQKPTQNRKGWVKGPRIRL